MQSLIIYPFFLFLEAYIKEAGTRQYGLDTVAILELDISAESCLFIVHNQTVQKAQKALDSS